MASVDSLSILITASTASATTKINALTKALGELSAAINGLDVSKFESLAAATGDLANNLSGIKGNAAKDIQKISESIKTASEDKAPFEGVKKSVEDVAEKSKEAVTGVEQIDQTLKGVDPVSIDGMSESLEKASQVMEKTTTKMATFKMLLKGLRITIPTDDLLKVDKKIEKTSEKLEELRDKLNYKSAHVEGYVDSKDMEKDQQKIAALINELDRLKLKKEELESNGGLKLNNWNFADIQSGVKRANKALEGFISKLRKANSASRDTSKSTKSFDAAAKQLTKSLTRVTKMLKLMITRMALRTVIKETGNGFKSLALHCEEFDNAMSGIINSSKKLAYSFAAMVAPLINALAPALIYIINLLTKFINIINQVFSALGGGSTYNKAKDFTGKWSDNIEAANSSAKELKKTVLGFDELNQLQDNKSSGGGGTNDIQDMFDTLPIENRWKTLADYIKSLAKKLFDPIKRAWDKVGDEVIKAWKKALNKLKKLGSDVARDFWKVWEQPQTQRIFENLFKIIRDIGDFVGNLAKQFDEAWNKNDAGLRLLEKIRDIIDIIVEGIQKVTESWAEWADSIDFSPLLEGTNELLEALKEPIHVLMGMFEDLNKDFIQPLAKWLFEEGLPQLEAAFTNFANKVDWVTLRDRIDRVWKVLEPFAETVGEGLIEFIERVGDKIANFLNSEGWESFIDSLERWTKDIDADDIANGLELICDALIGYAALSGTMAVFTGISAFFASISKFGATVAAAFKTIYNAMKMVANFMTTPSWMTFVTFLSNPASVISISNIIDMCRGTFLDPDEWVGYIGEFVDKVGILWNDLWVILGSPLIMIETILNGGTMDDYAAEMDKAWQSIDKYNESVKKLKEYNLDTSGSYKEIIDRANNLNDTMSHVSVDVKKSTDIVAGAAKDLKANAETSFVNVSAGAAKMSKSVEKDTSAIVISFESAETDVANSGFAMQGTINEVTQTFDKDSSEIQKTADTIKDSFSEDKWTFSGVIDGLSKTFGDAIAAVKKKWNELAQLNGEYEIGVGKLKIKLPKFFAGGGFPDPEDGWFRASQGEMLGKFDNGKSVVANNQQITDGIAQAVYQAMMSANSGNSGNVPVYTTVQIDGETIARAVTKGQRGLNRRYSPTMA